MTSGQKVAFSLLLSVLAFCAFTVVAFSGLFDLLEVNFYQPIVQEIKQKKIEEIAAAQNEYFQILMKRFDAFSLAPDVRTYVESRPADSAVKSREQLRTQLLTSTAALLGIRIIDDNGRNLYFSTYGSDLISGARGISYRNYDSSGELSYDSVRSKKSGSSSEEKCRIIKDGEKNRLIFSLPFYNSADEYKGSILFYCDALNFSQFLYNRNLIDVKGFATLVTDSRGKGREIDGFGGFVFGLPNYGRASIQAEILEKWRADGENFWKLSPLESEAAEDEGKNSLKDSFSDFEAFFGRAKSNSLCAFSFKQAREDFGFITFLYSETELKFPPYIRILLLATAFVTLYLAIFLILSFKHDDIVIIRDKIHRYENEFFISYQKMGEGKSADYLVQQKPVLEKRILKSLGKKGEKHAAEFKAIFESSWQEMSARFGALLPALGANAAPALNAAELKEIVRSSLEDILENGKIQINAATVIAPAEKSGLVEKDGKAESVEEEEEISEAESAEENEEAESVEELDEVPDTEEVAEIEEAESAEELEEVPEPESAEEIEEAASVEELEEIPEAESAEETEGAESVEELDEVPDMEEVAEIEEAEPVEELEEIPEAESAEENEGAESVEELEEVPGTEEVAEIEEAESLEEVEEIPEPESAEEIEEAASVEELDEVPDTKEIAEIEDAEFIEELEKIPEAEALADSESEAAVSEELEPTGDMSGELLLGDGRTEACEGDEPVFSTVGEEDLKQKFEEELEMLPEVSEYEARAFDIAKTLEALPENAPGWADNDDVELDSEGLIRKPSVSELHDIAKLKEVARSIDEMDTNLEELEADIEPEDALESTDADYYLPQLLSKRDEAEDDVYKDEVLLEKIEFGVPTVEVVSNDTDDSVAEDFIAFPLDYSFLDEDDADEKIYASEPARDITDSLHFFKNPLPAAESAESEEILEASSDSAENQDMSLEEELVALESVTPDDADYVEVLDSPEENMPFMFTKLGSDANSEITELSPVSQDAIVQDADGTYRVTEFSQGGESLVLNADFKKLVDSILR